MRILWQMVFVLMSANVWADNTVDPYLDFSPFPLSGGDMAEYAGVWENDIITIKIDLSEMTYWGMPMLTYQELNRVSGDITTGFAWVSHSKDFYWLSISLPDGQRVTKKLYFGLLKNAHSFSRSCGEGSQAVAIAILDENDRLEVPDTQSMYIDQKAEVCKFH